VACMGACSQAPVMRIDDDTYGNLTADQTRTVVRELMAELGIGPHELGVVAEGAEGGERP
jgi:(2Fe-2S) ferredoxin